MIRILADATFPKSLESHGTTRLHFQVLDVEYVRTDTELAQLASAERFHGLALLGRDVLAQRELVQSVQEAGICLIATNTDDPVEAVEQLGEHVNALFVGVGPGRILLVLSHEVRAVQPAVADDQAV